MQKHRARGAPASLLVVALAALGLAGGTQAKPTGAFTRFASCPYENSEVRKCIHSVTESGEILLGDKKVPIEEPVTLQGGLGPVDESTEFSKFFAPTSGPALSRAPQRVPGGLLGILPEASQPPLVKALIGFFFENSLTGVDSTLELARPATAIEVSEFHLAGEEQVALKLPLRVHLENPFLGKSCFIGSSSSPIVWNLTTGTTAPPAPNTPIAGAGGQGTFLEGGQIIELKNNKLVDNAWAAPAPRGCGGFLSFLITPIIEAQLASATAGHNAAILTGTLSTTSSDAVKNDDEENP
jgi:hypothetical protein